VRLLHRAGVAHRIVQLIVAPRERHRFARSPEGEGEFQAFHHLRDTHLDVVVPRQSVCQVLVTLVAAIEEIGEASLADLVEGDDHLRHERRGAKEVRLVDQSERDAGRAACEGGEHGPAFKDRIVFPAHQMIRDPERVIPQRLGLPCQLHRSRRIERGVRRGAKHLEARGGEDRYTETELDGRHTTFPSRTLA